MRRSAALVLALLAGPAFGSCEGDGHFNVGAAEVSLAFDEKRFTLRRAEACTWVARATTAVARYFGRFPVPSVTIRVSPAGGAGVSNGTTFGHAQGNRPLILVNLGRRAEAAALADDWVLTHELTHLAVPEVPDESHWLEEGIATYVEPIARVQAGELSAVRIWGDMHADMWKGTPDRGDEGLDRTPTWGRTYWGGALFCLLADVEIRQRTANRKGLQDALRGVLAAGGSIERRWSVDEILAAGDAATGVPVLRELYANMKDAPGPGMDELDALWKKLGVVGVRGREVRFDDAAPLAAVRRAITAPR